jgi:hypothetical protein
MRSNVGLEGTNVLHKSCHPSRLRKGLGRAALLLALALMTGCLGTLEPMKGAFDRADYPDAKTKMLAIEEPRLNAKDHVEYMLYRGLIHGALGDTDSARVWLGKAKAALQLAPDALSPEDKMRLETGLRTYTP